MRFVLFLAVVGVLTHGAVLDNDNPPASVFHFAAGEIGLRIFGVVLWSAAISSVVVHLIPRFLFSRPSILHL
jgi:Mn2+/Fe2+ NRAMP family transporter